MGKRVVHSAPEAHQEGAGKDGGAAQSRSRAACSSARSCTGPVEEQEWGQQPAPCGCCHGIQIGRLGPAGSSWPLTPGGDGATLAARTNSWCVGRPLGDFFPLAGYRSADENKGRAPLHTLRIGDANWVARIKLLGWQNILLLWLQFVFFIVYFWPLLWSLLCFPSAWNSVSMYFVWSLCALPRTSLGRCALSTVRQRYRRTPLWMSARRQSGGKSFAAEARSKAPTSRR